MITLFSFIKNNLKVIGILVVLFLTFSAGFQYGNSLSADYWQQRWLQRDLADAKNQTYNEQQQRALEQKRQSALIKEQKNAEEELALARDHIVSADRMSDRLRTQIRLLQKQLAGSETGRLSATTGLRTAKSETALLLADLLRESDGLAGKYAKQADEAYIAGKNCEVIYRQVINP